MATVNKDFRVKNGLVVEGTTATVDGEDIITTGSTTDDLNEGSTNQYYTTARAKTDAAALLTGATQTNISITGDGDGLTITAENGVDDSTTDDLDEGSTNLYFTNQRALDATASAYDAAGAASTAESNANNYTDSLIGDGTVDGSSGNTVTDRIATAVSDLVDLAPDALNTLNELAAAIGDDENFSTTITTAIGEKVAKSGDTMTGHLTLNADPTSDLHAATKQYVDNLAIDLADYSTDDLPEGSTNLYFTDARAQSAIDGTDVAFTSVEIDSLALQVAATATLSDTNQTAVYSWAKSSYRSAKLVIKAAYSTHTEVSEILVTLDTSDNIAITEYAVVGTNGTLGTVTAAINGTDVEILYTAGTANTDVTVFGTLIA